jgi:enoyl-CoA hydratase/carnithine racemase
MSQAVRYARRGGIGIITVDNPPVNALSQAVRQEASIEGRRIAVPHWG